MSSSSDFDEKNTMEKANSESRENKDNEPKLETDLNSLKIGDTDKKDKSSTIDEGTVKKKSSVHYYKYEESFRNTETPEAVRNMDISKELLSRQNTFRTRSTSEEGAGATNWRSSPTNYPKEKRGYTSGSSLLSWRDPKHKYERCKQTDTSASSSRKWRNEESRESRSRSFKDESAPTYAKNRDESKMGCWTLSCAPDIVLDNGLTEVEHVWNCVNELYEQNGELFANKRPTQIKTRKGCININCFTSNYQDIVHIAKVANILIEKIRHYPYCFMYFHDYSTMYMRTCEKELYKLTENNYKLIDFDE